MSVPFCVAAPMLLAACAVPAVMSALVSTVLNVSSFNGVPLMALLTTALAMLLVTFCMRLAVNLSTACVVLMACAFAPVWPVVMVLFT